MSESRYNFIIGLKDELDSGGFDRIKKYLDIVLGLKKDSDYLVLENLYLVNAKLTLDQAEELKRDLRDWIDIDTDRDLQLLGEDPKRLESILKS